MEGMEARIAAYRVRHWMGVDAHERFMHCYSQESRKRPEPSLYDKMFMDSTLIKQKYRPGGKAPKN